MMTDPKHMHGWGGLTYLLWFCDQNRYITPFKIQILISMVETILYVYAYLHKYVYINISI